MVRFSYPFSLVFSFYFMGSVPIQSQTDCLLRTNKGWGYTAPYPPINLHAMDKYSIDNHPICPFCTHSMKWHSLSFGTLDHRCRLWKQSLGTKGREPSEKTIKILLKLSIYGLSNVFSLEPSRWWNYHICQRICFRLTVSQ